MRLKNTKYKNRKTEIDGILFDSAKEAKRYAELKLLLRAKLISNLEMQVSLPIIINDVKICSYVADFKYEENGRVVYEDVKGFRTAIYNLKKKIVKAVHGIDIKET
jgi:hypothetical protein